MREKAARTDHQCVVAHGGCEQGRQASIGKAHRFSVFQIRRKIAALLGRNLDARHDGNGAEHPHGFSQEKVVSQVAEAEPPVDMDSHLVSPLSEKTLF